MTSEDAIKYIKNAMSLRSPQLKSLELLADYLNSDVGNLVLSYRNNREKRDLPKILNDSLRFFNNTVNEPNFTEFERAFPAYTFALATGVGKTRLMGAFVVFLYLVYNIRHFLIVAPNLTVYRKLLDDFSKNNNPKYVFKGIQEVNTNTTKIITTDNYANYKQQDLFGNQIAINIFNIQQFAQSDMTGERGITKSWETADLSYFEYLQSLNDLVVMLDESHHYHADAAFNSLDLLNPLLGLEMTATPILGSMGSGRNRRPIYMKNVVYYYNLGDAISGNLVKDPWVGTEGDVDFSQFDPDSVETDARKLQLAVYFHERAKLALKEYALENNKPIVKPVLLIVAKNTNHARDLRNLIDNDNFRNGDYKGKVLEIHTKLQGAEADENIEKLISLEKPDNYIEIVIHVNMLKEGWDVTNVYTIAPLRSSAAEILTEQTIGRGLRLPFGEKTGVPLVDRLIIVAHDQYERVIQAAQTSTLIQGHVETVSESETRESKKLMEVPPIFLSNVKNTISQSNVVMNVVEQIANQFVENIPNKNIYDPNVITEIKNSKVDELLTNITKETIRATTFSNYHGQSSIAPEISLGMDSLFGSISSELKDELSNIAKNSSKSLEFRNIPIPRLNLTPHFSSLIIHDFNLDSSKLRTYTNERSIIEQRLQDNEDYNLFGDKIHGNHDIQITRVNSFGEYIRQSPQSTIIASLLDFPIIDYDDPTQKLILLKLSAQAIEFYGKNISDKNSLALMIESNINSIANDIYSQILNHTEYIGKSFLDSQIAEPKPFLEQYNISMLPNETVYKLDSSKANFGANYVYGHFQKACHPMYKFDSTPEVRLACILDRDNDVEDWLRPAPNQFEGLYWRDSKGDSNRRYEPDFVVELSKNIVIVEVKPESEFNDPDVQSKKLTAEEYCVIVNNNIGNYGIVKPWKYIIVPSEKILLTSTARALLEI